MQNKREAFDYEALKKKTLEQLRSAKDLFSKGEAFTPFLKDFLEAALESEFEEHLDQQTHLSSSLNCSMTLNCCNSSAFLRGAFTF